MLHRRHFLVCAAAAMAACTRDVGAPVSIPPGTRLIVLRHADRSGDLLSAQGHARARALVAALDGVAIDAIYSPSFQRNLDTGRPLARARGLDIAALPSENPARALMAAGAGKTIVWIGNKGNLASIWADLRAPGPAPLNYGDLFIVERGPDGTPRVTRRHFGA